MADNGFDQIEQTLRNGGSKAGFDLLLEKFRAEKKYPLLFEARLMVTRHALGLPLIQVGQIDDVPPEARPAYEQAFIAAAREVGALFLAEGDIPRAWSYFRAIGEPAPVVAAIDKLPVEDVPEGVVEVAFHQGAHPRKGFEMILANYGTCRAITSYSQYPAREGREECLRLLVRNVHHDLVASLKRAISGVEGQAPDTESLIPLIAGRDWLFESNSYYLDTSHVISVIQFSIELTDRETLELAYELTEYGRRLGPLFQFKGEAPFENAYIDYGMYLRALLEDDADAAVEYFRRKMDAYEPSEIGTYPAQVLVGLLARIKRYREAIDFSRKYLADTDASQLSCPSVLQLCQLAGDYEELRKIAMERGDLLSFMAAAVQTKSPSAQPSRLR
jgi:hypothetical protein